MNVCLVEAGPDYGPVGSGRWPPELLDPRRLPRTHDWGYVEERPNGTHVRESRAKVVGGCSAHNQCALVWPRPEDYDSWANAGNPGWSHRELQRLIEHVEERVPRRRYADEELAGWQRLFLRSAVNAGFPRIGDMSALHPPEAVAPFQANVKESVRWNAAFAFLDPVRERSKLTVLERTLADRLVMDGDRAVGLICRTERGELELRAESFLLCAGTYGSPALLMRSGIGPRHLLETLGIPVVLDLAGVGRNLHDHVGVSVRYEPRERALRALDLDLSAGRLDQSQVILRLQSSRAEGGFDLHVLPYQAQRSSAAWTFELLVFAMAPRSRGNVFLRSADPVEPPRIDFRWLTDAGGHDRAVVEDGVCVAARLVSTTPLSESVAGVAESDFDSAVGGYGHAVGTCRMGPFADPRSVVDSSARVHATAGVFVGDASIIPAIPRANTNLTCFLIGLRVAEGLASALR